MSESTRGLKVLVATDGSAAVIRACEMLARMLTTGPSVRLLTVIPLGMDPNTAWGVPLQDAPARARAVEKAVEAAVEGPKRVLAPLAPDPEVKRRFGNPADEILSEIDEWAPDLVVLGRRGLSPPERWLLGSVSERVVRHAKLPILISS